MDFGMPTLLESKSIEACAALCQALGLSFVELNMNLPAFLPSRLDAGRLKGIADDYGVYYTIHLDENLNPCDFNDIVAAAYTETVLQTIEAAKRLAVPILNMHLHTGVYFTLPDRKVYLFEEYAQEYVQKLTAFRDACEAAIGGSGIKICVENCGDFGGRPSALTALAVLLESPAFGLTFDVGHNATAGYSDEPFLRENIGRLCHMHIHDASGRGNHLVLGEVTVALENYFQLAKARGCRVVLEVKTEDGLRRSVAWMREKGLLGGLT